jgi:hypothetical protein
MKEPAVATATATARVIPLDRARAAGLTVAERMIDANGGRPMHRDLDPAERNRPVAARIHPVHR